MMTDEPFPPIAGQRAVTPLVRVTMAVSRLTAFLWASDGRLTDRLLRSGAWVSISNTGVSLLQTARSIVLARLLAPDVFGLMGLCFVVVRGLELFTETGIGPALIQRQQRIEEAKHTAFTIQVGRGFLLAALASLAAPLAAQYYGEPQLRNVVIVLSLGFMIVGFSNINVVALHKRLDFRLIASRELLVGVMSTALIIGLAIWLRSVWALAVGHVLTQALRVLISYQLVPERPVLGFDRQIAWELFRYGRFITGLTIVLFVTTEIDKLVVGKVLGLEGLGYYTLAFTLANLPATHVSKVAAMVVFPAYSSMQGDLAKMRVAYLTVLKVVSGVAFPAAAGMAILAAEVVAVAYGERWLPMVRVLQILSLFGAARAIGVVGGSLYNALGRPNITFYLSAAKLAIILPTIYVMTSRFGLEGAAIGVAGPQVLLDTAGLYVVTRQTGLRVGQIASVLVGALWPTVVMVLAVAAIRPVFHPVGAVDLLVLVLVGAGVYGTLRRRDVLELYRDHIRPRRNVAISHAASSPTPP
jgi:O-antigen/teichoic acid export membrane protein